MADGSYITADDLELAPAAVGGTDAGKQLNLKQVREEAEQNAIKRALSAANNNITDAANALGITRPTLYSMLEKYGLKPQG